MARVPKAGPKRTRPGFLPESAAVAVSTSSKLKARGMVALWGHDAHYGVTSSIFDADLAASSSFFRVSSL